MARPRVHQHVNPLAKYFRELPVESLDFSAVFAVPDLPLHVDLGCGRGRFLLEMATQLPQWNHLGIEIREPLVEDANKKAVEADLKNIHYVFCNAPLHLGKLLDNAAANIAKLVTIQFPDPWFKKRHAKRRMVNEELVRLVSGILADDGRVFIQTDVLELFEEMTELFIAEGFETESLRENFLPVRTEREISVENRSLPVYRALFSKKLNKNGPGQAR
ncbi:MAG: tRNA (guanosine(46)-N7)-methyltransferase TrmB [Acidobacteriota bacterium]|nr:tRNA (guanosine(46)-N7)-methyltransferase TrmB [Acidobacteriota bacterium]